MTDFYFVDSNGNRLPSMDVENTQHIRQYGVRWRVYVDEEWTGRVALESNPLLYFVRVSANEWELPQEVPAGAVGSLSVLLLDGAEQIVKAKRTLQIQPANVSWDELDQMLDDIGLMGLLLTSCTEADVWAPIEDNIGISGIGSTTEFGHGSLQIATNLISLYKVLRRSWPTIIHRPIKSIVRKIGVMRLDNAKSSPGLMIKRKIEPGRATAAGLVLEEDVNCPENGFLAYLLDHYLINLAQGVAKIIRSSKEQTIPDNTIANLQVSRASSTKLRTFTDKAKRQANEISKKYEAYQHSINERLIELEGVIEWATNARKLSFLKAVPTPAQFSVASLRLIHSPHYGPVYAKFVQCEATTIGKLEQVLYLLECVQNHRIKLAWNIYELWCVTKFYTKFVTDLRLRPPKGEPSLSDQIRFIDGEISLPKNIPFRLAGRFGSRDIEVEIWYEKKYQIRGRLIANPDVVIMISINGISSEFCFDAKYRNYHSQGPEKFFDDVYRIAHQKYQKQFGFRSGFILHTDTRVNYWGEVGISNFLSEQFGTDATSTEPFAEHRYGAVSFRPGLDVDRQFRKLTQLIFQYHSSIKDTCLNCGYRLEISKDMQHDWKEKVRIGDETLVKAVIESSNSKFNGTGIYCFCPNCGNFWVIQRCQGEGHHLIKTRPEVCIHRPSSRPEHSGKWIYICPVCGSDPDFRRHVNTSSEEWSETSYPEDTSSFPTIPPDWL